MLGEALKADAFVAPSHYLLADIARQSGDEPEERHHLDSSIAHDPKYGAPYYLRASIELAANDKKAALQDLDLAVLYGGLILCQNLQDDAAIATTWKGLADDAQFKKLQAQCKYSP